MAAGDTSEGRRVEDVADPRKAHARLGEGEYRLVHDHPASGGAEAGHGPVWECRPPGQPESVQGNLANHEVTEHEDGTITVSPSILIETSWAGEPVTWHGYLERGVWREV